MVLQEMPALITTSENLSIPLREIVLEQEQKYPKYIHSREH